MMTKWRGTARRGAAAAAAACVIACSALTGVAQAAPLSVLRPALMTEGGVGQTVTNQGWTTSGEVCLTAGLDTAQTPIPGCDLPSPDAAGSGTIRFGHLAGNTAGSMVFNHSIPAVRGIIVTFDEAQWGGPTGGDGTSFYLQNGDVPIDLGTSADGFNASYLGYAPRPGGHTTTGLPEALAGIGFDTWGQFSQDLSNGVGCANLGGALAPETVTVRGPGNGTDGYCLVMPGQAVTGIYGATRADATRHVEISIDPRGMVNDYVVVKVDGNEVFDWPLHSFAPVGYTGDTLETVNRYRFGFGSNTGGFGTNVNEVWNVHAVFPVSLRVDTSTTETRFTRRHQVLHYQFRIINIGGDTVSGLRIHHGAFRLNNLHCPLTTLVPAQATICTATHRVNGAQAYADTVTDKVWATGIRASGRHDASPRSHHVLSR